MPIVVPNEGAPYLLGFTVGLADPTSRTWEVHLYVNNYTPVPSTTVASFTECSVPGYAPIVIPVSGWGAPTIISNRASSTYTGINPLVFTNTGSLPVVVYGYWVEDETDGVTLFAEQFATPQTLNAGGDLDLTVIFTGGTQL